MGWKDFFRKPSRHYYYGDYYEHPKREEPIRRPEPKPISTTEEKVKIPKPEIQTDVKRPDEIKEPRDMGSYFENKHQKEIDCLVDFIKAINTYLCLLLWRQKSNINKYLSL